MLTAICFCPSHYFHLDFIYMETLLKSLDKALLTPIRSIKKRYIPLLMIYFAFGAQGLTSVALTFWEKEALGLSAEQFLVIGAWVGLPWTMKMIFGQLVDVVPILGSRRRSYVFLGASLMVIQFLLLYGMATNWPPMMNLWGEFQWYLIANLFGVFGFMIQDVTADTMSTEVVDRTQSADDIRKEVTLIQILGRLSLMIAIAAVSGLGGWLAGTIPYEQVFLLALVIPLISILGAVFVKLDTPDKVTAQLDPQIIGGGLAFAAFSIFMAFKDFPLSQEIVFGVSITLIGYLLWHLIKKQPVAEQKIILFSLLAIFIFRATPSVGPGFSWWAIDILGFDAQFFGILKQVGALTALAVLWLSSDFIARKPIKWVLLFLIGAEFLFSLPDLALYYGLYETVGVSPQTIALFDVALESPLVHISMIPMLALIAYYAPVGNRGTWFAVAASFMNLSLVAGKLISKYLNQAFVVSREVVNDAGQVIVPQNYDALGWLLWLVLGLSTLVPLIAVLGLMRDKTLYHQPSKV